MKLLSIAIDGPAGSGKSTVAKEIANILKITYLDTGAMYRMVTLSLLNNKIDFEDIAKIQQTLNNIQIEFLESGLYLDSKNVTDEIRSKEVANNVSKVAAIKIVREKMVLMQREIAKGQSIIMDGRDIGTHVLTEASHKFYLTATVEERARRRMIDFENQNIKITFEELLQDIKTRDENDMNRCISPLRQAEDAILVDTTEMTSEGVIDYIVRKIGE